jgi:hypothetical protein
MIYLLALIGGIFYRMRGGWPSTPRPFEQMLFCLPVGYVAYLGTDWYYALIIYALSVGACLKGHGRNMDLGAWKGDADFEDYERWTGYYKLHGKIPEYWYDVGGVAISGLIVTLPLIFINPLAAFAGLLKAPAYMLGWWMHPNYDDGKIKFNIYKFTLRSSTEWGEYFTGLFIWLGLIACL